jgi:hypothetical protein
VSQWGGSLLPCFESLFVVKTDSFVISYIISSRAFASIFAHSRVHIVGQDVVAVSLTTSKGKHVPRSSSAGLLLFSTTTPKAYTCILPAVLPHHYY